MMIKTRLLLILTLLVSVLIPANAVMNEGSLDESLRILHGELKDANVNMYNRTRLQRSRTEAMRLKMIETMKTADKNALMLYTQKMDQVFGLTYACSKATKQYDLFTEDMSPLVQQAKTNDNEVARYDSLIDVLTKIYPIEMSAQSVKERDSCVVLAKIIKQHLMQYQAQTTLYIWYYNYTAGYLKKLSDYADNRYKQIQNKVFINGNETLLHILEHWDDRYPVIKEMLDGGFISDDSNSEWGGGVMLTLFLSILGYILVLLQANYFITRYLGKRNPETTVVLQKLHDSHQNNQTCFVIACSALVFALSLSVFRMIVDQHFINMATRHILYFAWMITAILISTLIRTNGKRAVHTVMLYAPLMVEGFIIIVCRIILIPNVLINLFFPPLVLLCLLWQTFLTFRYWKEIDTSDKIYTSVNQLLLIAIALYSWNGYILLSVQMLIWWMMQLTCLLTITCITKYLRKYGEIHEMQTKSVARSWWYNLLLMVCCPIAVIESFVGSAYFGADVFSMLDVVSSFLDTNFIQTNNITLSLTNILEVVNLWFVARYIYFEISSLISERYRDNGMPMVKEKSMLYAKCFQITVYGTWFLLSMYILQISTTWIIAACGGLATGLGFASKDILENIYYGIALVAGRLKIGDVVLIGDLQGKIQTMNYSTTVLKADDGSIVTFTNTQLIGKNYKNLTRDKDLNCITVETNIDLDSDTDSVRSILTQTLLELPCVKEPNSRPNGHKDAVSIAVKRMSRVTGITLTIEVWVDPVTSTSDKSLVTECVLKTLKANNIEIM